MHLLIIGFSCLFSIFALAAPSLEELDRTANWQAQPVYSTASYIKGFQLQHAKKPMPEHARPYVDPNEVDFDAELNLVQDAGFHSLNPVLLNSNDEMVIQHLINVTIVDFDLQGRPVGNGDAIVSWHTSEDRTMDKVVLRDDLDWNDGKPVTAEDVTFAVEVMQNEDVPIPMLRDTVKNIKEVRAFGEKTVVFFHKNGRTSNRMSLWMRPIPKHVFAKTIKEDPKLTEHDNHRKYEDAPVTCGPYRVVKRDDLSSLIVLERWDRWHLRNAKRIRQLPFFKTIRSRRLADVSAQMQFEGGDIDLKIFSPQEWLTANNNATLVKKSHFLRTNPSGFTYFGWNQKGFFFNDIRVRQAMAYAFPYEQNSKINGHDLNAAPMGIYHPSMWRGVKVKPNPYKHDLQKAAQLLKEAGWSDTNNDGILDKVINGKRTNFDFNILTMPVRINMNIASSLKGELEKIGVRATVKPTDAMFSTVMDGRFNAYLAGWGWDNNYDTDISLFTSKGNDYGYNNPQIDKLFDAIRNEPDTGKQQEYFAQINEHIMRDQPVLPVWHSIPRYGFAKRLSGFQTLMGQPFDHAPGILGLWSKKLEPKK